MLMFKSLSDSVSVAGQIDPADLAGLAEQGFASVICNRPDGEERGQPTHAELMAAAEAAGLNVHFIPFQGMPTADMVDALSAIMAEGAAGKTLLFCRSGARSTTLWALWSAKSGHAAPRDIVRSARDAG
jgi:sulfide:quinone oxidoreductase